MFDSSKNEMDLPCSNLSIAFITNIIIRSKDIFCYLVIELDWNIFIININANFYKDLCIMSLYLSVK